MKKKLVATSMAMALTLSMLAGCGSASSGSASSTSSAAGSSAASSTAAASGSATASSDSDKVWKVGMTVFDMTNPIWASYIDYIYAHQAEHNMEFTIVDGAESSSKQLEQIENFIQSGVDALNLAPVEGPPIDAAINEALDQGIVVTQHPNYCENCTAAYILDDHTYGYECGKLAARYINEELGGKAKVGVFRYDTMESVVPRGDGIEDAIKELAPDAEIVIEGNAGTTQEGMDTAENFLQAYPDLDVICCINDAGAIGAVETAKAAGISTDSLAIFGCDGIQEAIQYMKDGEYMKGTVSMGGDQAYCEEWLFPTLEAALKGEEVEQYTDWAIEPVYGDEWQECAEKMGYELE